MAQVNILFTGYLSEESAGRTCPTVTLVRAGSHNIIVDPGTVPDAAQLAVKLKEFGLTPETIDIVYLTHSHYDHFRNIGLFTRARVLDFWGWWNNDLWAEYKEELSPEIKMIKTPGHSPDGTTLLVQTSKGVVAICGDVFFKENFPVLDPYATDPGQLRQSRLSVLDQSDYVIPGHGPMFDVKK